MNCLRIYPTTINDRYIDIAVEALRQGDIIIYPTDTLYALACDALNQQAIEKLCKLKGINTSKNTLAIVCSNIAQASQYARIDNNAFSIIRRHCPGAFTFILPASPALPKAFKGRKTVGIRIPSNPISQELAKSLGNPLLTSSLPSEGLSDDEITSPDEIMLRHESSSIALMIDGGQGSNESSTIVDITDSSSPQIIRHGLGDYQP